MYRLENINWGLSGESLYQDIRRVMFNSDIDYLNREVEYSRVRPELHFMTVISREDLSDINGFDEQFKDGRCYDDDEFVMRIQRKGIQLRALDTSVPFVFHQEHTHHLGGDDYVQRNLHNQRLLNAAKQSACIRANPQKTVIQPTNPNAISVVILTNGDMKMFPDCFSHVMNGTNPENEILVICHRPTGAGRAVIEKTISNNNRIRVIINTTANSCAELWNQCIINASHPDVLIVNDRVRPKKENFDKAAELARQGYAFAGVYRFGFFQFNKYLIHQIGWFDERLSGGGFEDCDMLRRILEKNLSYWEDEEVPNLPGGRWDSKYAEEFFRAKWRGPLEIERKFPEEQIYPDIRESYNKYARRYLPAKYSKMCDSSKELKQVVAIQSGERL